MVAPEQSIGAGLWLRPTDAVLGKHLDGDWSTGYRAQPRVGSACGSMHEHRRRNAGREEIA